MKYAVVIATYNRADSVVTAIQCLLRQTIAPNQIIIVDASPHFDRQRNAVLNNVTISENIGLSYIEAEFASLTVQRNQGIQQIDDDIDVVFLIDDDSYMFENCAEQILTVYADDSSERIIGIQFGLTSQSPVVKINVDQQIKRKRMGSDSKVANFVRNKFNYIWKELLLMSAEKLFIPYDGCYATQPTDYTLPQGASHKTLFHGCRMTFRKKLFEKELFDSDLVRYCALEDLDFSYRASRHGVLIECPKALLYHHSADAGRLSRLNAIKMSVFNTALFIYKHSLDYQGDVTKYRKLYIRRLIAEFIKDSMTGRLSYPQLRGAWLGARLGLKLLRTERNSQEAIDKCKSEFT